MFILLAEMITDDAFIDHVAEVVLLMCLCDKVIVLCPLSILSALEQGHNAMPQGSGGMLPFLQAGMSP